MVTNSTAVFLDLRYIVIVTATGST